MTCVVFIGAGIEGGNGGLFELLFEFEERGCGNISGVLTRVDD